MTTKRGFNRYELDERVLAQLEELGFRYPTEVQEKVIPLFIQKRNLIVEAPTGTGKTAAYGLPLISRLDLLKKRTQALVLVPSRELAIQVATALQSYYQGDRLKVKAVYGGTGIEESFKNIKSTPHILVAVPGRLRDVMSQYKYDFLWKDIKFLIVDEGDKLLESGFQKDFDLIREHIRKRIQVGFFSATISADTETLIRERIRDIQTVRLSPKQMLRNIQFSFVKVPDGKREIYLEELISHFSIPKSLIFCARRQEILAVTGFLRKNGHKAETYFGNQEQNERVNILRRFKENHIDFLVASDLAARGLDIADLPSVINLSIPQEFDFYLHRIGRTGRAGNRGKVFNIISSSAEIIRMERHHKQIEIGIKPVQLTPSKNRAEIEPKHLWVKYHLSRGKRDKIRKGDIVGFLINNAGMEAEAIGTITIYDSYSVVDMPQGGFEALQQQEATLSIKGKSLKIRKYQVEEQQRKAQAVKRLKKDRKRS